MRQLGNATNRQRAKNYKQEDSKTSLTSQFQTAHRLAARAKTRAIFVKRTGLDCAIRYRPTEPPPSPRDENSTLVTKSKSGMSDKSDLAGTLRDLLTKNIFSSRKALHPSRRCRFRRLGSEQTAVGRVTNFRQEIF